MIHSFIEKQMIHYLLFAGYYEDENYHDDSYVADQQFPMSWANLINVVSIIIKENIFMQLDVHNIGISKHQNDLLSFKTYLARLYVICDIMYNNGYCLRNLNFWICNFLHTCIPFPGPI